MNIPQERVKFTDNQAVKNVAHYVRAFWANLKNGSPAKKLYIIGVTGTKGKTTTTHLISAVLDAAGQKNGRVSTVDFKIGAKKRENNTNKTALPPWELQPLLKEMVDAKCRYAVVEVSSHGMAQHRYLGIPFKGAVFTNLGHDHLDYHKTIEAYKAEKKKLFTKDTLKFAVVNGDDKHSAEFLKVTKAPIKLAFTAKKRMKKGISDAAVVEATNISLNPIGSSFRLQHELESVHIKLKLPGLFNVMNALSAATVGVALNIKLGTIKDGLEAVSQVPGRMDKIETNRGFSAIIDYAHTPDSLEAILQTLRPIVRGKIIAVFGATGDRDKTKRPIMGAIGARYADIVIVTDEEPYTEDPEKIIDEVAKGVPRGRPLFAGKKTRSRPRLEMKVQDVRQFMRKSEAGDGEGDWWFKIKSRRAAIEKAISMAGFDDLVLITGMGAQNYKIVKDKKIEWNDKKVVEEILKKKKYL